MSLAVEAMEAMGDGDVDLRSRGGAGAAVAAKDARGAGVAS